MKKLLLKGMFALTIGFFAISCSEDGKDGMDGINGINGLNGSNGANGANGNANVVGSQEFTTSAANWSSSGGGLFWQTNLTGASIITQNIVDRGIVLVFRKYVANGLAQWAPLPDTNTNVNISYTYGLGVISFFTQSTNATIIPNPGVITFRYVVISPSNKLAHPNTNWNDFEEVKKVLNLKD